VGYGRFAFDLGDVGNDIVPPFVYDYIYVGVAGYVPLRTTYVGVDVAGGYLGVLGIGADAMNTYNTSGIEPTSNGFTALAGLSGQIWRSLGWRAAFELLGFHTVHTGIGRGWGLDPTTVIGQGGNGIQTTGPSLDIFWRAVLMVFYRFGWTPADGVRGRSPAAGEDEEGGRAEPEDGEDEGRRHGARREDREPDEEERPADEWDDGDW
jgi:hypothetical protein